ncbi:uncharacterized protein LOC8062871 [Sorghum bicolor]|uniref:Membrane-associated kinase regulator 6 n=1 Tax=Sorghum bicolor TaxID=4558 RepID=C5WUF4_SORBI|nr:uncharacterized protein LOC8062871 [Sorghum bicolor]EER92020.1 hypothetical protein SORBI_3001G315200 [Sorghum bicolor]|eukprot:XP_002465022.1 uncharacterized protein LOC8062871 [Sorghum bicolor]
MEASSPSRSDSFSRGGGWPRWKPRSSFERLDVVVDAAATLGESFSGSTASFIDMDPEELLFSMRWTTSEEDGFHFGLPPRACSPLLASSAGLAVFSDDSLLHLPCEGGVRDVIGGSSYADAASSGCSSPAAFHTAHSTPASVIISASRSRRPGAGAGGASKPLLATRRILLRYLRFLVPLCRKARALRRLPVPVPGRVFSAPRSSRALATTPARRSTSSSASSSGAAEYWCHGNADVDVRDAILHCKKSLLTARTEC